jgi:uncharacterized membrane protein
LLANFVPKKTQTAISEVKTGQQELKVYPNPATGNVQVVLPEKMETAEIQITDVTGCLVSTALQTTATGSYSLTGYSPGVYLLSASDGTNHICTKILKK